MKREKWKIVKLFIGGILEGLTYEEVTTVKFELGEEVKKPVAGSPYRIISVEYLGVM